MALSGLTMAEYFRDEMGQDVLLFVDNIFRFSQAGSEVSALLPFAICCWLTTNSIERNGYPSGTDNFNQERFDHILPSGLCTSR